jgi:hypothetical protein
MTLQVQVRCINKTDRSNPHERIRSIGGVNSNGAQWKLTVEQAILGIKQNRWSFYVQIGTERAQVIIAKSSQGNEYLRTVADSEQPDNLLSLPECP